MTKQIFRLFTPAILITLFTSILVSAQVPYRQQYNPHYNQSGYNNGYYNNNDYQPKRTIAERIQNQRNRVAEGLRDHSLTRVEADRLQARMVGLQRDLDRATRNGFVSNVEVNHIQAELDSISRNIYDAKHNANFNNGNFNNHFPNQWRNR